MTTSASTPARIGYSGKSLAAKLGLAPGMRVRTLEAPADYWSLAEFDPAQVHQTARGGGLDFVHLFVTRAAVLAKRLPALSRAIRPGGMIWISWPKRSAGTDTDLTEDGIRACALPLGLVDVKVCAVDATWSGLKLVWRLERRKELTS